MCACPTKCQANAVGEEHLRQWHVINVHKYVLLGKEFGTKGIIY